MKLRVAEQTRDCPRESPSRGCPLSCVAIVATCAIGVVVATCGWAGDRIAFGPYVQNVTRKSATVCWSTPAGESKITTPDGERIVRHYQHHEILLPRLKPGTTYPYDVLGDGSEEGKGGFTTFPDGLEPFRFVVFGDTRSRHDVHETIVKRIMAEAPLLVINTGDLVSDGRNIADWEQFFRVSRELMRNVPYFPVLGNHESDSPLYFEFFALPGNERYYTFSVGDALFLMLDTEGAEYETPQFLKPQNREAFWHGQNKAYMERQKAWVENMLHLQRDAGFIFVVFHEPLYSVKASRVEDAALRRAFWGDLFERYGVQAVLSGHDHHYHHAVNKGTHYITTGGAGAGLYDTDAPQPQTVKMAKIEHYITVDVGLDEAKLTAIDIDGNVIEEITVPKRR